MIHSTTVRRPMAHKPRRALYRALLIIVALALIITLAAPALAAITIGTSTTASSGGTTPLAIAKPSGTVAGDVLVACIFASGYWDFTILAPDGWQVIQSTAIPQPYAHTMTTYYRIAGASEPATYSWAASQSLYGFSGGITRLTGIDVNQIVNASAEGHGTATGDPVTATAPSVTTTYPNETIINFFGSYAALENPAFYEGTFTPALSPLYEWAPVASGSYEPPSVAAYTWEQSSAGATGTRTCRMNTRTSSTSWIAQTVAFKAAPRAYFPTTSTSTGEAASNRSVQVNLAPSAAGPVEVYFTVGGTAKPGTDYTMTTTSPVTVNTGAGSASIGFTILEDDLYESNETIVITLTGGSEYYLDGSTQYTFTILNDDTTAPTPIIASHGSTYGTSPLVSGVPQKWISIAKPEGTKSGDFLLASLVISGNSSSIDVTSMTPAGGWTLIQHTFATYQHILTYYRVADSTDAGISNYRWDYEIYTTFFEAVGGITRYTGVALTAPIDEVTQGQGDAQEIGTTNYAEATAPAIWPDYTADRIVTVFGTWFNLDRTGTDGAFSPPTGMTELYECTYYDDATMIHWPTIGVSEMNWVPASGWGVVPDAKTTYLHIKDQQGSPEWGAQTIALKASRLSVSDASVIEGNSGQSPTLFFTVSLDHKTNIPVTFNWATADGTATVSGKDYQMWSGTNDTIPAGQTSVTIGVPITGDVALEADETFYMNITNVVGAIVIDSQGVGTILNDDSNLTINSVTQNEGNSGTTDFTFTVTLSPSCSVPVSVNYSALSGDEWTGTAQQTADYQYVTGTLNFAAGQTSKTITVPVVGDTVWEPDETFSVLLSSPINAHSAPTYPNDRGVGTIRNDDAPPNVTINDVSRAEGNSGSSSMLFTVTLSSKSSSNISVNYATANGTATAGTDYTSTSGTLTIASGATTGTISVPIVGDTAYEPDETFYVNLSGATAGAVITDSQGVGTITNDDTNTGPVATPQSVTTAEDTSVPVTLAGTDPDGDPIMDWVATSPAHGTLSGAKPNYIYTPVANYNGPDSFTFTVSDGSLTSAPATVSITVTEVNDPPVPANDNKTTDEDVPLSFPASDLLANDSKGPPDESGQMLTVTGLSSYCVGGGVELVGSTIIFTPTDHWYGTAYFEYCVTDDGTTNGALDPKTGWAFVYVTVNPVNDAPNAQMQSVTTAEDTPVAITLFGWDIDEPATGLDYTIATQPSHGSLSGTAPDLTYTPAADYNGDDSFTFTVSDESLTSAPATVSIKVTEVNDPPTANPDSKSTDEGVALVFAASELVANDSKGPADESGQTLTVTAVSDPVNGTVGLASGTITFTPAAGFSGAASFTYTVTDNGTTNKAADPKSANGTVSVTVNKVNQAPVVTTDPGIQDIVYGASASFTSTATGTPAPTVQWQVSSNGGTSYSNVTDGEVYSGTTTTTLSLTQPPVAYNGYKYRAVFSNGTSPDAVSAAAILSVSKLGITGSFTVEDKVYDGMTAAVVTNRDLTGEVAGDDVILTGGTATFADRNVGTGKAVTLTGATLTGTDAGNYTLDSVADATAAIAAKAVTPAIVANDKIYDGLATANLSSQTVGGVISPDTVTLLVGEANFADANVGTWTVTATSLSLGGADAGNYSLAASTATDEATITAMSLTISGAAAQDKTYDGNNTAPVDFTGATLEGVIDGDTVSINSSGYFATFDSKNVGTDKPVTVAGVTLSGTAAVNYTLTQPSGLTADITKLGITGSFTAADKVYDGTTAATVSGRSLTGVLAGDDVSLTGGTATFADKNVGAGKTVTLTGATLGGTDTGNYTLTSVANAQADITPRILTVQYTGVDKVYDRTTTATVGTTDDRVTDDVFDILRTAAFTDKSVGISKTVNVSGVSLSGGAAGNYSVAASGTATADITPRPVTPAIVANDKIYDGLTTANLSSQTVSGVIAPDAVTLAVGEANFADKNVGTWTVTATTLSLGGADAGNYSLASSIATDEANITAANLTISGAVAQDKTYDGNNNATVDFTKASLVGAVNPDDVGINTAGHSATFDNKNAGIDKPVTVLGVTLSGTDAGNYALTQPTGLTADITKLGVTGTFTAEDKVYDGTTAAVVASRDLTGAVPDDGVSLTGGTAAFADKNVGTDKTVTLTGATLSGTAAGNYTLNSVATTTADITPRPIVVTAVSDTKIYDGTTTSSKTPTITSPLGLVSGDSAVWTQTFDTKDAGTNKTLTPAGTVTDGNDGANYDVTLTPVSNGVIEKATLTVTAENKSSQYSDPRMPFTATYGGFVAGEKWETSGVTGLPSYTTDPALSDPIMQQPGNYTIQPGLGTLEADNYAFIYETGTYTVTAEDAVITFDSQNPVSVKVVSDGGKNSAFTWRATISQANDGYLGSMSPITDSDITLSFASVGVGGGWTGPASSFDPATGVAIFEVPENVLGVETYGGTITLNSAWFDAAPTEDVLVIYDPSLGFTTGGGWFYWPAGTRNPELEGVKTNFGFTMKYNKKGTGVQGSFLLIAHLPDGGIIRMKSNAIYGLAITNTTYPGAASFSGKCVYTRLDADGNVVAESGNQEFTVYVQDMDEPGTGTDMLWFTTKLTVAGERPFSLDSNGNSKVDEGEWVSLGGGNIVVPHTKSSSDTTDTGETTPTKPDRKK